MRFMLLVMLPADHPAESGALPDAKLMERMERFNDDLRKAGVLLALDGFHPTSKGARIVFSGGKRSVVTGPFAGVHEVVGGYWLIEAKSRDEAIEWATRCPSPFGERGVGAIEVRQVMEVSDFPVEPRPAAR